MWLSLPPPRVVCKGTSRLLFLQKRSKQSQWIWNGSNETQMSGFPVPWNGAETENVRSLLVSHTLSLVSPSNVGSFAKDKVIHGMISIVLIL